MTRVNNLFVYGTLRKDFQHDFYDLLEKNSIYMGIGFVKAKLFDLGDYPGAIASNDIYSLLSGEVYQINQDRLSFVLNELDNYEEYYKDNLNCSEYIRKIVSVSMGNDEFINSWIYWYNQSIDGKLLVTNGDYLQYKMSKINK